jgi:putative sterol carrier protein
MAEAETPDAQNADIASLDADQLAQLVAGSDDSQLAEGMADPQNRKAVLDEIFRRMGEHANPDAVKNIEAVIHFKVLDHPDGGHDHYEVVVENGAVQTSDSPSRDPKVSFALAPVDFLRLGSGNAQGPALFMSGKLKIEGDLMFAAQVTGLFQVPKAA